MKKLISLCLALVMALLMASCADKNNQTKNSTEDGSQTVETQTPAPDEQTTADTKAAPLADAAVELMPAGYEIVCANVEDPASFSGKTFDMIPSGSPDEYHTAAHISVRVTETATGREAFSILLRTEIAAGLLGLLDRENVQAYSSELLARRGTAWLFAIYTEPEGNKSCFLYDTAVDNAVRLGAVTYGRELLLGSCILLHPSVYSEEAGQPLDVYDWTGRSVHSYPKLFDYRVCWGLLYLLGDETNDTLMSVPAERFSAASPDFTADTVCRLNGWMARFSYAEGEEEMMYLAPAGGNEFSCAINEAAYYVGGVDGENLNVSGKVKESCDLFTVTLPDYWKDKYICYREADSLSFHHKASEESPDFGSYTSLLFSLSAYEAPETPEDAMSGDSSYVLCLLHSGGVTYELSLSEPGGTPCPPECREEYLSLRAALLGNPRYHMDKNVTQVKEGARVETLDYSYLIGEYEGHNSYGDKYTLRITGANLGRIHGQIGWYSADNPFPGEFADMEARMFGTAQDQGNIMWDAPNYYYDETEGFSSAYGGGYLRAEGKDTIFFTMYGEGDSWTNSGEEITLTRVS